MPIEGSNTSLNDIVPKFNNNNIQASKAPGTTAGNKPLPGTIFNPRSLKLFKVANSGATPWPHITIGSLFFGAKINGTSPPGPFKWGSTTWRVNPVATAASNALPPFSNIDIPTAEAIQWVDVTMPKLPTISGLVVNLFIKKLIKNIKKLTLYYYLAIIKLIFKSRNQ